MDKPKFVGYVVSGSSVTTSDAKKAGIIKTSEAEKKDKEKKIKQKFRKLTFVRVVETMPLQMAHFPKEFDAIVEGTYSQIYGGRNILEYSLFQIENGKVVDHKRWYWEDQLTELPEQDRKRAEKMIEEYRLKD